jgi:hypothetical protein
MFAGALSAARELGASPYYFDGRNGRVTFIDDLRSDRIKHIESVEDFLLLNGDGLSLSENGARKEFSPDRSLLTEMLWKHRDKIARHYKDLCDINDRHDKLRNKNADRTPFKIECDGLVFELDKNMVATAIGGELNLRFPSWPGFAKYLAGGWFEEYVYLQCKPYEDARIIRDLRINVELRLEREDAGLQHNWHASYSELDIVFTDGYSLYIAECKAGKVTQDQIMKLQNLVRIYGGVEGHGIVACCFPPHMESVRKRIRDAKLELCCGRSFLDDLKSVMDGIAKRAKSIRKSV